MDTTLVVDYGSHTVKHMCLSGHGKTSAYDFSIGHTLSRAYHDNVLDVVPFGQHLSELISDSCVEDFSALTLLLLLDVFLPQWKRELILKCCFECLDAKRVFLGYSAATALFSAGETTGMSVDVGYSAVRVVPVVGGMVQSPSCAEVRTVGARHTDNVLRRHLPGAEEPLLLALKASACHVGDETAGALPSRITLPDGKTLPLPLSPAACREAGNALLFCAPFVSAPAVLQYTYQASLLEFPLIKQWALFGGASAMRGTREAFCAGISHVVSLSHSFPRELQMKTPNHAAISGGVILSHLSSFKGMCVSAAEYAERGPHCCIHRKMADGR